MYVIQLLSFIFPSQTLSSQIIPKDIISTNHKLSLFVNDSPFFLPAKKSIIFRLFNCSQGILEEAIRFIDNDVNQNSVELQHLSWNKRVAKNFLNNFLNSLKEPEIIGDN